jgi:hypothetical protein
VGVLGGAGRTLDVGEAFAILAGGALDAGGGASPNRAADAGPPTRAKTAIREIRTNMENGTAIRKCWPVFIPPVKASPCGRN